MKCHLLQCHVTMKEEAVEILLSTSGGDTNLLTFEALHIQELKPQNQYERQIPEPHPDN